MTGTTMSAGADDLFIAVMALNRRTFDAGNFDDAYHALAAALHLGQMTGNHHSLVLVAQTAREQLARIDRDAPGYRHSSLSTRQRGYKMPGVWEVLANVAQAHVGSSDAVYPVAAKQHKEV
ncbi:MAG: hypothetical protein H7145_24065 [Akkermansiaceae bacterium]|nr:hypothetical protein [Armatimonadota bacterium]